MKQILQIFFLLFITSLFSQQKDFEVFNTSINSKYAELGVTYLNGNTVFFASSKKNDTDKIFKKDRRKNNRQLYLELYQAVILENGDLIQTSKFSSEINNKFFESDISFTPDRKSIYFTWNNFYNLEKRVDSAKWKTMQIMKADLNENLEISNIRRLPFNSEKHSVRSPEVSKNGKQLFFVSDMPNGFGKTDIYVVNILGENSYSKPRNLGSHINTKESEMFPYISQNNTLYFSSYGHKGKGLLDIFKSNFKNGNYQKAENLPSPFNSKYDDFAFVINEVKNTGYFTSSRKGGKGDVDIYAFKLKEEVIVCTKVISGIIIDKETQKPIDNVLISLYHNSVLQETKTIHKDSKYSFKLICDENYKIVAKKENYSTIEFEIIPDNNMSNEILKNLELAPISCNQLVIGKVLNSDINLPIEFVQVSLYENNILKETKNVNTEFSFDLECNKSYKIVAEKENFTTVEVEFQTNNNNALETNKILSLTPIECNQLVLGKVLNSETNLPIEFVQVSLYQNNILKETKNVNTEFSFDLECNKSYKIVAEKENFTTVEVEFQTNNNNALETTKILSLTPIECNQLMLGKVLNSETNLPIEFVQVSLYQNNILKETKNVNTEFSFDLECNKPYKIIAEKENYSTTEIIFKTNEAYNLNTSKTLTLTPVKCTQLMAGTVLDKETKKPLTEAIVKIYEGNHILKTLKLDTLATFDIEINCNTEYRIEASLKNYLQDIFIVHTPSLLNQTFTKTFLLEENIEFVTVGEKKMIETKSIDFDIDQSKITLETAIKLEKVIYILNKYPTIELEIKSHTDSRTPDEYSLKLTNKRAQSIINHIISNGINPERIYGRGYGESELLNKCSNGVKCSQAEHEINRRTEFIIIKE